MKILITLLLAFFGGLFVSSPLGAPKTIYINKVETATTSLIVGYATSGSPVSGFSNDASYATTGLVATKISTSTGLGVVNFASPNISQWTNNSGYLTSQLSWATSGTNISVFTNDVGYITSSVLGGLLAANNLLELTLTAPTARANLGLGTAATYSFTDWLASSTAYIADNLGNWAGNWQGVASTTFYLASNPSGFITTSTYNTNFGTAASRPLTDFLASSTVVNTPSTTIPTNNTQLTNGASYATTGLVATKLSTSTGLTSANMATSAIAQWVNNNLYAVSSTVNAAIALKISTSTYNVAAQSCSGSDKVSSISATGIVTCTTDQTGGGGAATSSVRAAIVVDKIYTNQTAARNSWGNSATNDSLADLTGKTTCRSLVQVTVAGVNNNAKVQVQFATSSKTTWYQMDGSSATGATSTAVGAVSIGVASASSSPWVVTHANMRNGVYLRMSAWDGNGVADPAISSWVECF